MGLRVTQGLLLNHALQNITSNTLQLGALREQLSTGMRVNRPSDDPTAFLRMLPLAGDIETMRRYQDNALLAGDILETGAAAFEDASSIMSEAKRIAVQGANGSLNDADRKTLASSVNQLLSQMVGLANSKLGDRYLFGGSATSTKPFALSNGSGGTYVSYQGNDSDVSIQIAPGTDMSIASSGRDLFMQTTRGATAFTGKTGAKPGTGTDSGTGKGTLQIEHTGFTNLPAGITAGTTPATSLGSLSFTITSGPSTISINGGPAVAFDASSTNLEIQVGNSPEGTSDKVWLDMSAYSAGAATGTFTSDARMTWDGGASYTTVDFSATNQQLVHADTGQTLNVDSTAIARTGSEEVSFGGTYDAFNVLVALRDLLQNDAGLSSGEVSGRITTLIGEIDAASDNLLEGLRDLGSRSSQLELTRNRMSDLEITLEGALSRDRDIDISEVILRMTQRDVAYQSSLAVGARVISTTLLDFLR